VLVPRQFYKQPMFLVQPQLRVVGYLHGPKYYTYATRRGTTPKFTFRCVTPDRISTAFILPQMEPSLLMKHVQLKPPSRMLMGEGIAAV
jgi:hypothetical protein